MVGVGILVGVKVAVPHKSWSDEIGLRLPQELIATTSHLYVRCWVIGKSTFVVPDGVDSLFLRISPVSSSVTVMLYETASDDVVQEQLA